jgi:hypothetical protein
LSYRHSSYRKMSAAVKKAMQEDTPPLMRSEMNRVLHWSNQPPLPKPAGWGKPRDRRA